jgi:hypothetical protein
MTALFRVQPAVDGCWHGPLTPVRDVISGVLVVCLVSCGGVVSSGGVVGVDQSAERLGVPFFRGRGQPCPRRCGQRRTTGVGADRQSADRVVRVDLAFGWGAHGDAWLRAATVTVAVRASRCGSRWQGRPAGAGRGRWGRRVCRPGGRAWRGERGPLRRAEDHVRAGSGSGAGESAGGGGRAPGNVGGRPRRVSGRRVPALGASPGREVPGPARAVAPAPAAPQTRPPGRATSRSSPGSAAANWS